MLPSQASALSVMSSYSSAIASSSTRGASSAASRAAGRAALPRATRARTQPCRSFGMSNRGSGVTPTTPSSCRAPISRTISNSHAGLRHFASASSQSFAPPQNEATSHSDIVIVGGGVVGLGLACDLVSRELYPASSNASEAQPITLIEASDLSRLRTWASSKSARYSSSTPSSSSEYTSDDGIDWENRVISLTAENLTWLRNIGVFPYLVEHRLRSVTAMRVWDGLSGALLDFDSADLGSTASTDSMSGGSQISVMVEISNLQQAMLRYLEEGSGRGICVVKDASKVDTIIPGSKLDSTETEHSSDQDPWPVVRLTNGDSIQSRLLVGADGPNSPVRKYAGIGDYGWPYERKGLVGTLRCAGPERGEAPVGTTAYQRFLPSGTIAFLPLSETTGSMVWTLEPKVAEALTTLHRDTAGSPEEPLALLVDAAFRLPWSYIEQLFERVVTYASLPQFQQGSAGSTTGAVGSGRNWSWLLPEIPTEAEWVERDLGAPLPESSTGEVPPKVMSLDAKSVASFPLNLKHADAYLGASLNGSSLLPSGLLSGALAAVGIAPLGAGQGDGRGRTALVGDAAHTIHPLAGQGLNLGIADIRSLSQTIQTAVASGADIGSYNALKSYARDRYWENQKMLSAVDHLHWLFAGTPVPMADQADKGRLQRERDGLVKSIAKEAVGRGVVWARSTGMEVINELGFVKNGFMRQAGSTTGGNTPPGAGSPSNSTAASSTSASTASPFGTGQVRSLHVLRRAASTTTTNVLSSPSPSLAASTLTMQIRRHSSHATGPLASDAYTKRNGDGSGFSPTDEAAVTGTPALSSLTPSQRRALQDMLRVDHSGEVAANTIYQGQADMFGALGDVKNRDLSIEMLQTEKKHLDVMRALLRQHQVRPSLLLPVWATAGRVLGGVTALLGPRSAMACTEAVESVIGEHYDDQLKELASILEREGITTASLSKSDTADLAQMSSSSSSQPQTAEHTTVDANAGAASTTNTSSSQNPDIHPSLPLLSDIIKEFRDDELEHLDTAVEHESQQAAGHALLSAVIAAGCRGAIWVASRV
ncbi:ubiquinone biosynthesis hydrox [Testicularia cyperi]|uniref:5-demethoxyubiquinone hydroxylase, mitochondrial n=1 Tax=Testicularia cyperi TaxID=1882483 RepID=A0A317XUS4_9BASI|nr:ubiquinone biosynthesis hydrox [Testicularia cyperi]